jgi:ribosomal protein S18 acetylase RimI-like enzyme
MQIRQASVEDVDILLPLFLAYRAFYKRELAEKQARTFLEHNLAQKRSTVFIAENGNGKTVGFVQMYWHLSSLSMAPVLYLSDLYVDEDVRKQGIARKLMQQAQTYGIESGAVRTELHTAHSNVNAQKLYESLGYEWDQEYRGYSLSLPIAVTGRV